MRVLVLKRLNSFFCVATEFKIFYKKKCVFILVVNSKIKRINYNKAGMLLQLI